MGPHAASLGMRFHTGSMFPAAYKNTIFVARHGSWNESQKFGGAVAVVKLTKGGAVESVEPFLTGFLENDSYIGRPVDVLQLKDGEVIPPALRGKGDAPCGGKSVGIGGLAALLTAW
jgi:glucose/arabinose dehydrogenase